MKKTILFIAVFTAFSFASCKKDHTCTCTDTYNGSSQTQIKTYTKSKKAEARANCLSGTYTEGTDVYTFTCTLN